MILSCHMARVFCLHTFNFALYNLKTMQNENLQQKFISIREQMDNY